MDFIDQEMETLKLLGQDTTRQRLEERLELLLVDEFQDTSPIQLALFLRLADVAGKAVFVGDRKQSIFAFRGTDPVLMEASASERKGWLNRAMELNAVPTFWLTNDVGSLDPAFVRRFDVVVEFPVPPRHQREKILRKACPNGLGEAHGCGLDSPLPRLRRYILLQNA